MALLINNKYCKIIDYSNQEITYKIYETKDIRDFEKENIENIMSFIEKAKASVYKEVDEITEYLMNNNITTVEELSKLDIYLDYLKNAKMQDEMLALDNYFFENGKKPNLRFKDYWESLGFKDLYLEVQVKDMGTTSIYVGVEMHSIKEAYEVLKTRLTNCKDC